MHHERILPRISGKHRKQLIIFGLEVGCTFALPSSSTSETNIYFHWCTTQGDVISELHCGLAMQESTQSPNPTALRSADSSHQAPRAPKHRLGGDPGLPSCCSGQWDRSRMLCATTTLTSVAYFSLFPQPCGLPSPRSGSSLSTGTAAGTAAFHALEPPVVQWGPSLRPDRALMAFSLLHINLGFIF